MPHHIGHLAKITDWPHICILASVMNIMRCEIKVKLTVKPQLNLVNCELLNFMILLRLISSTIFFLMWSPLERRHIF